MTVRLEPLGRAAELAALSPRRAALELAWPGIIENFVAAVSTTVPRETEASGGTPMLVIQTVVIRMTSPRRRVDLVNFVGTTPR